MPACAGTGVKDHEEPSHSYAALNAPAPVVTAMQKLAEEQETPPRTNDSRRFVAMKVRGDHLVPFQVTAPPSSSTMTQKLDEAHVTPELGTGSACPAGDQLLPPCQTNVFETTSSAIQKLAEGQSTLTS